MNRNGDRFLGTAALIGGLAVAAGAFGAHALEGHVPEPRLATFETAARYAMYHALALLGVGILSNRALAAPTWLIWSGRLFVIGTVLFSGSLFALVLADLPWLGAITPLGGACYLAGWAALGVSVGRNEKTPDGAVPPRV